MIYSFEYCIVVPNFSRALKQKKGTPVEYIVDEKDERNLGNLLTQYEIVVYPNGHSLKNKGFVSVLLLVRRNNDFMNEKDASCFFACIVSLLDNFGESRFPQSFYVTSCPTDLNSEVSNPCSTFGLERFAKQSTLLNNSGDFLCGDCLTIHCYTEISFDIEFLQSRFGSKLKRTTMDNCTISGWQPFNTTFFEYLKSESNYFRAITETPMQESSREYMKIPSDEWLSFEYIETACVTGKFDDVYFMDQLFNIYSVANKYGILEMMKLSSECLENEMDFENVIDILILADRNSDQHLKAVAIKFIRTYWQEVRFKEGWASLKKNRKDLSNEVLQEFFRGREKKPDEAREMHSTEEYDKIEKLHEFEILSYIN